MERANEAEVPSTGAPVRPGHSTSAAGPGADVEQPSRVPFSPADVLHWQSRAGNAAVGVVLARRSAPRSVQRQGHDGGTSDAGGSDAGAPPLPPITIVGVDKLAGELENLLKRNDDPAKDRALEWLNVYNVRDIARVLKLLKAGTLDALEKHAEARRDTWFGRPLVNLSIKAFKSPGSVTDADLAWAFPNPENQGQKKEFQIRWDLLEDTFLPRFEEVCKALSVPAERLLAVMLSETNTTDGALNVHAMHPGGKAGGIVQFTDVALQEIKVTDSVADVAEKSATDQLGLVLSFLEPRKRHLTSLGRIYQATFVPGTLGTKRAPTDVLVREFAETSEEQNLYKQNSVLDKDKDHEITIEDLEQTAAAKLDRATRLLQVLRARRKPAP